MFLGNNAMCSSQDFWIAFIVISFFVLKAHSGQDTEKLQKAGQEESVYFKEKNIFK